MTILNLSDFILIFKKFYLKFSHSRSNTCLARTTLTSNK